MITRSARDPGRSTSQSESLVPTYAQRGFGTNAQSAGNFESHGETGREHFLPIAHVGKRHKTTTRDAVSSVTKDAVSSPTRQIHDGTTEAPHDTHDTQRFSRCHKSPTQAWNKHEESKQCTTAEISSGACENAPRRFKRLCHTNLPVGNTTTSTYATTRHAPFQRKRKAMAMAATPRFTSRKSPAFGKAGNSTDT